MQAWSASPQAVQRAASVGNSTTPALADGKQRRKRRERFGVVTQRLFVTRQQTSSSRVPIRIEVLRQQSSAARSNVSLCASPPASCQHVLHMQFRLCSAHPRAVVRIDLFHIQWLGCFARFPTCVIIGSAKRNDYRWRLQCQNSPECCSTSHLCR